MFSFLKTNLSVFMNLIIRCLLIILISFISLKTSFSNDLELTREFNLITSENASGYLKPLFTTFGEGLNTALYNNAFHSAGWSLGLNFSFAGMIIPESHLNYDAVLPDLYGNNERVKTAQLINGKYYENISGTSKQPTIYGGRSNSIFAAPQNLTPPDSFYKSVGFLEGNDIGFMSALPVVQLYIGLPTRSELRFRFMSFGMQGAPFTYFTIGLNQNIDKAFKINKPDDPFSYGFTVAYHSISRDKGIDISSLGLGAIASNRFGENFNVYGGLMYETFSGSILMVRQDFKTDEYLNSPYSEIRRGENLNVKVESFNSFRLTAGASYDLHSFKFHGDISYAAQPVLNFGVSIKFLEHKDEIFETIEYPIPEIDIKPTPQIANLNFTKPYEPETLPLAKEKEKVWEFEVSMKMFGIKDNNQKELDTIIVEEFESRQTRAILPYIFFGDNESEIPSKYNRILPESTSGFTFNGLLGKSPLESYYDILNVIGYRLRERSEALVTLTGTNNNLGKEKNNTKLSKLRAENVKNYLTQVWNISPDRIKVESRNLPKVPSSNRIPDGQEENRRVEISSNDLEITAPVFIIDTILRVNPDIIKYMPKVNSEAGLAKWTINSSVSGKDLSMNFEGGEKFPDNLEWNLVGENIKKRQLEKELITNISATDKEKNYRNINLRHPIKIISVKDKRLNATKDTSLNVYNLILFDYDKSSLSQTNMKITDFIKSELTPNTDVTIFGFTDRIGDDAYNLKLSTSRAESTGKSLGGHPYKVEGVGESKLIYDNDLPEGRFYSRTVVVEAKVPIN